MDVDLSTDLRGLLPLVAPLLSGHSDLAIGTRLAHGARVVRGPKREFISRSYNRAPAHRAAHALLRCPVRLQGGAARRPRRPARRGARRRLVLRHRAARARPAPRAADPRGAGRLGRRSGLARRRSCARRSTTSRASRGWRRRRAWRASCTSARPPRSRTRCCSSRCADRSAPARANALALAITAVGNTAANRRLTFGMRGRAGLVRQHALGAVVYVLTLAPDQRRARSSCAASTPAPPRGRRARGPGRCEHGRDGHAVRRAAHLGVRPAPRRISALPASFTAGSQLAAPGFRRQWVRMADAHRILVVDDEPNIVDVLSMALRYQGFEVETAATGEQALAAAAAFKPQLMVLDIMLPDMEGFEVARRLGARRAEIPIMFLTARDATEDKVRGLDDRRRRLRHEAVQPRGAGRPHPHDPAPHRPGRAATRAGSRSRTSSSTTTRARSRAPARRSSSPRPSTGCCAT